MDIREGIVVGRYYLKMMYQDKKLVDLESMMAIIVSVLTKFKKKIFFYLKYLVHILHSIVVYTDSFIADLWNAKTNKVDLFSMPERIALVTGGSRGIGLEVVRMFLKCDMEVIIACRNCQIGRKAVEQIRNSGVRTGKAKVYELDNASLKSVRNFVAKIKKDYKKLDILVNNAGVLFTPYEETEDGFELQYQINYLSHFLLTSLLLPLMKNAGTSEQGARIINVSSCTHFVGKINFEDINYKQDFVTSYCYSQSKLAQVLFTKSLARLFDTNNINIQIHAVDPGIVNTELHSHLYAFSYQFSAALKEKIFKTPSDGATPIVFAAISPEVESKNGLDINNCLESSVSPIAHDLSIQNRLFDLSLKQLSMTNFCEHF